MTILEFTLKNIKKLHSYNTQHYSIAAAYKKTLLNFDIAHILLTSKVEA